MSSTRRRPRGYLRYLLPVLAAALIPAGFAAAATGPSPEADHPGAYAPFRSAGLTANPDCTLAVPADPLSAAGLGTPYVLHSAGLACSENDEGTAAFVQATILDPATGALSVYNPVVENPGDHAVPAPAKLPPGAVVTLWTGFNANVLKLTGPGHRAFVNFAQQAYAGSPRFFAALRAAIAAGRVTVPPLGTSPADHLACPSVRSFSVVDQDQSDNVPVAYPAYGVVNGSDDNLITYIDRDLGCTPWQVPDQVNGGTATAGPLEEVQAAAYQAAPQALVPGLDPFVTRNGQPDLFLQNLYRLQTGQPLTADGNDTAAYCQDLAAYGAPRLKADAGFETGPAPAFTDPAKSLAAVLEGRFAATWHNLGCDAGGAVSPY